MALSKTTLEGIAQQLFDAFVRQDLTAVGEMLAPEAIITQNGSSNPWSAARPQLAAMMDWIGDHRYTDVRRVVGENAVVEEHRVVSVTTDGKSIDLLACVVIRTNDAGLITSLDEYVDTSGI